MEPKTVPALEQQIEAAELDVMEKTRVARTAESELRIAVVRRHDLHERYRIAFRREKGVSS
jgi:hypothetical protein